MVNKNLLADGMEFQLIHTLHEQDFSERGNERYFAGAIGRTYLTLQRIKYSYSGTAAAIDKAKRYPDILWNTEEYNPSSPKQTIR